MDQLAEEGTLVPLDAVLDMTAVSRDYAPAWIDLGRHDGKLYGIFYKVTSKAAVWYNPKAFAAAGYVVPATWDEMIRLADRIVADGRLPFSSWPRRVPRADGRSPTGSRRSSSTTAARTSTTGGSPPRSPGRDACIKRSFERVPRDRLDEGVRARRQCSASSRPATTSARTRSTRTRRPPTVLSLASFAQAFIAANHPDLEPGTDYDVFPFPAINPAHQGAVTVGADVPVMVERHPGRSLVHGLPRERASAGNVDQARRLHLGEPQRVSRRVPGSGRADAWPRSSPRPPSAGSAPAT